MHRRTLVHRFALGCRSCCFTWNGRARGDTIPSNPDSAQPHPRVIARQSQGSGPARFHVDRRDRATTALDITPAVSRETSMPCRAVLSSIRAAPASCRRVIGLRTTGCVTGLRATECPGGEGRDEPATDGRCHARVRHGPEPAPTDRTSGPRRPCSPPKRQPTPGADHPADRPDPAPTVKVTKPTRRPADPADHRPNHSVTDPQPMQLPERRLRIPPHTLGAWLGDGDPAAPRITSAAPEITWHIEADGLTGRSKAPVGA